jgi:hypothetical protein
VLGGKIHEFVVELFGVFARQFRVSAHGLASDFCQATGLSHTIAFGDMFHDGNDLIFGQTGVEKNGAFVFRELFFAMQTPEQSGVIFAIHSSNGDIFFATNAIFRAIFILTTEVVEIVHDSIPYPQIP